MSHAVDQIQEIKSKINKALKNSNRAQSGCTLVAVSKTFSSDEIRPTLIAGHRVFGENRVQEAKSKWPELRKEFQNVELHLIGPLQSNKTHEAVALFDVIQSVDRKKIAQSIANEITKQQKNIPVFIQVNIGYEPQKAGVKPEETKAFVSFCQEECHLDVKGLMCIPPFDQDPAPYFNKLKSLNDALELSELSMGMSADFEEAISYGATYVRVGSAIFGKRI